MAAFTALFDACVLYPAPLRDLLMHLALTDLFRAKWSDRIHEEWMQGVLKKRPDLTREKLERTRDLMNQHVRDCLVEHYEDLIPSLNLSDEKDRHVLAAAIHGRADVIVTFNLKHFPSGALAQYGIEAQHPDDFITHLIDLSLKKVCESAKNARQNLMCPPKSVDEYLNTLSNQGLAVAVSQLKKYPELL